MERARPHSSYDDRHRARWLCEFPADGSTRRLRLGRCDLCGCGWETTARAARRGGRGCPWRPVARQLGRHSAGRDRSVQPLPPVRQDTRQSKTRVALFGDSDIYPPYDCGKYHPTKSNRYQWLPSEFRVDASTGRVRIASYINNLRPDTHSGLYDSVAAIFERMLPLFERAIPPSPTFYPRVPGLVDSSLQEIVDEEYSDFLRLSDALRLERLVRMGGSAAAMGTTREKRVLLDEKIRQLDKGTMHAPFCRPDPMAFPDFDKWLFRNRHPEQQQQRASKLKGQRLQVIVRAQCTHLKPDKPQFVGDPYWSIDGTANEAIVATGMYFYSMENVTTSLLGFRRSFDEYAFGYELKPRRSGDNSSTYQQSSDPSATELHEAYDIDWCDPEVPWYDPPPVFRQRAGFAEQLQGRCIVFPHSGQQRTSSFELQNRNQGGHVKMLAFHVVDPDVHIVSTADVPPQQRGWMDERLHAAFRERLPREVVSCIAHFAHHPRTREEDNSIVHGIRTAFDRWRPTRAVSSEPY